MRHKIVFAATFMALSLVLTSLVVLMSTTQVRAQQVTISVEPSPIDVQPATNFVVEVWLRNIAAQPVDGFDVWITFDHTLATLVQVSRGPFVPLLDVFVKDPFPPAGVVHFWDTSINGAVMVGSGIIAYVEFSCDGVGDFPLHIDPGPTVLRNSSNEPILYQPIDGFVSQQYSIVHTYLDPPTYTVPISVPFTVNVKVQNITNLNKFSLTLTYTNTPAVDAIDIVIGDFLQGTITKKIIDDTNGSIYFDVESPPGNAVSGNGTIAVITFHCTGPGESILTIEQLTYWNPLGGVIPSTTAGGRVIQFSQWEPSRLIDIVEWPGSVAYVPLPGYVPEPSQGYIEIKTELELKGYNFIETEIVAMQLHGVIEDQEFSGNVASWWSHNTLKNGTRAALLLAEMQDGTNMAMGFVTNLLSPEQLPEVDPYIIVNAQPYLFVRFYWYEWPTDVYPIGRIVTWSYWWYDSHSHPNWFWGVYWWWRVYTKAYYRGLTWPPFDMNWAYWRPWWGWWWHWVYWRHWYWWSAYFPYSP